MPFPPRSVLQVGRSFPGEGSERSPYELNDRTRRNVRTRPEPRIADRIVRGQTIDPAMPALLLGPPFRRPGDAAPAAPASSGPSVDGGHRPTGCACGAH